MKKFLPFFLLMFAAASFTFAQTVVFSDNFDSYTVGSHLAASNSAWTTWDGETGGATDGLISNVQAASAPNSLHISENNDQLYTFNNDSTGHYQVTFKMYIPEGSAGYFNILHVFNGSYQTNIWAFECFFKPNGSGALVVAGDSVFFTYSTKTWLPVVIDIDLDQDLASLTVNNSVVNTWPFHHLGFNSTTGDNHLAAIDFYASPINNVVSAYYIDDFMVTDVFGVSVNEHNPTKVSVYPNPATDHLQIVSDEIQRVEVYNLLGQCVFSQSYGDTHVIIPTTDFTPGIYAVAVTTRNDRFTKKVMIW
jgi:hypothetical protein